MTSSDKTARQIETEQAILTCRKEWYWLYDAYTQDVFDDILLPAYTQAGRDYHDIRHIADLLKIFEEYEYLAHDPDLIRHAIFWHDVIYHTQNPDGTSRKDAVNIDESGLVFAQHALYMPLQKRHNVIDVIDCTNGHKIPESLHAYLRHDAGLFLDMDLSILARPWDEFQKWDARVRNEWPHVTDRDFFMGRAKVLESFAQRDAIYFTPELAHWNDRARENLSKMVAIYQSRLANLQPPHPAP